MVPKMASHVGSYAPRGSSLPHYFTNNTPKGYACDGDMSLISDISQLTLEDENTLDDHEALPSLRKLSPTQHIHQPLVHSLDPDLCITPEKTAEFRASRRKDNYSSSGFKGSRSSLKVRFDDIVDVRAISSEESLQDNRKFIGEDSTIVPDFNTTGDDDIIEVHRYSYVIDEDDCSLPHKEIYGNVSPPHSVDLREKLQHTNGDTMQVESSVPASTYEDHVLARREFNSTLFKMKKIQAVQMSDLDVAAALKKEITSSEQTQKHVAELVSAKVDVIESPQFVDLVGVNVPEEEVVSAVAQDRAAQVKATHKQKSRPEHYISNAPDIMEFFTDDLQKEFPSWTLPGIRVPQAQLITADPYQAFDLYQHIRAWENE